MADVDWSHHTDEEIARALQSVPQFYGPWSEWAEFFGGDGYAWSRREYTPGTMGHTGGTVTVMRATGAPGYTVSWWDASPALGGSLKRYALHATVEEAMACGDAWLRERGHRLQDKKEEP